MLSVMCLCLAQGLAPGSSRAKTLLPLRVGLRSGHVPLINPGFLQWPLSQTLTDSTPTANSDY